MAAPTPYLPSIVIDTVITKLGAFLQPFVGSLPIIRGQQNRVSMPKGPFVELMEVLTVPLGTPEVCNDLANSQINVSTSMRIDIQVDFYGPSAGDQCNSVVTIYRSEYSSAQFPSNIQPLYCSDGHQMALVTGEEQYESRWTLTATLEYNPVISLPQQSANTLKMNIFEDVK